MRWMSSGAKGSTPSMLLASRASTTPEMVISGRTGRAKSCSISWRALALPFLLAVNRNDRTQNLDAHRLQLGNGFAQGGASG